VDFEREAEVAKQAARAAAEVVARHSAGARESWEKAEDNPVTHADLEANRAIGSILERAFPEDALLSEETHDVPALRTRERLWIIDPLDGTKEFIQGIPEFAVSVGLAVRGEPVVGVVCVPLTGECFWAVQGRGAWLGDERLGVSRIDALEASSVLCSRTETSRGQLDPYRDWFAGLRPIGSVALKLAWVAAGRADLWISLAPKNEWDVCAGDLLVREAGGTFVTCDAGVRRYNRPDPLLSPPMLAGPHALVRGFRERSGAC
jgi:myo-inositol-1(or 4)-monophosphatase